MSATRPLPAPVLPRPASAPAPLFGWIAPEHPLGAALEVLRERAAERPPPSGGLRSRVDAEVHGVRGPGGWHLDRFTACTSTWGRSPEPVFRAQTLSWRAGAGPARWSALPDEPRLPGLAAVLPAPGRQPVDFAVLRYVPTRRLTWVTGGVVSKAKRPSRAQESYGRARALSDAASGSDVVVPRLRGTTAQPAGYRQDLVDGPSLAALARGADLPRLLAEAGRVHAALAELPAPRLPAHADDEVVPATVRAADWVAFLLPELRELLSRARTALLGSVPQPDASARATCHGDLVPSHLLAGPDGWTVIDLDLAHRGDRYRDLALFLSGLPADVTALGDDVAAPGLLDAAERAYLDGYAERWGHLPDARRLAWHRVAAEVHQLSVAASKDLLRPAAVARAAGVLQRLLPELGRAR